MSLAILPSSSSTHGLFSTACVVYQCEHGGEPSMLGIEHLVFPMDSGKWALPVCVKGIEFALLLGVCCPCFVTVEKVLVWCKYWRGKAMCAWNHCWQQRNTCSHHCIAQRGHREGKFIGVRNIAPQSTIIRLSRTSRWRLNFWHTLRRTKSKHVFFGPSPASDYNNIIIINNKTGCTVS